MPPITPELSAELGRRLRSMRDGLLASARAKVYTGEDAPPIAPNVHAGQPDDAPTGEMISHDMEHLGEHETAILHDIDVALGRLESGGAGICGVCGQDIPEERLLANPTAGTCIDCQNDIEKEKERREGRPPTM